MKIVLTVLSVFFCSHIFANAEPIQLKGEVIVVKAPISDPAESNPYTAYIVIRGLAAKSIYEHMIYKKPILGCDRELLTRSAGNLTCTKDKKTYRCNVGVNLKTGKADEALPC